jgi:hypothetical protein
VFAVVRLHEAGHLSWTEWAAALAEQIRRAKAADDPDLGEPQFVRAFGRPTGEVTFNDGHRGQHFGLDVFCAQGHK